MKHLLNPIPLLVLLLAGSLTGCGGSSGVTSYAASVPAAQSQAEQVEQTATSSAASSAEGTDVTEAYESQLVGTYDDDYKARYVFDKGGKLTLLEKVSDKTETTKGEWWVWKEGDTVYLYTSLQGTAHPARYTFEKNKQGVLNLYDDTTEELLTMLTPATCGTY